MTPEPAHLRVVDEAGQVFEQDECPGCAQRELVITKLEHRIRGLDLQLTMAKRDAEKEARKSGNWPLGVRLFAIWKAATGHPRSKFGADRLKLLEPFLASMSTKRAEIGTKPGPPRTPYEACAAAIIGRALDCYTVKRPNGMVKHFNEWERIFKDRKEWEDSIARRPRNWRELAREYDPKTPKPTKPPPAPDFEQIPLTDP